MITLRLPYPPSVNSYWRHISKGPMAGRVLISDEGRKYRETVMKLTEDHKLDMRLGVVIEAVMPDRRRRDIDNITKALLDALTHAQVWGDDSQIDDLHIVRREVEAPGYVWVHITPLGMTAPSLQGELLGAAA